MVIFSKRKWATVIKRLRTTVPAEERFVPLKTRLRKKRMQR